MRGFHLLAIAKTSTPQLPLAVTKQNLPNLRTTPLPSRWSGQRRFSSAARLFGAHLKLRAPHSPFLQELHSKSCALAQNCDFACAFIYYKCCAFENHASQKAHSICRMLSAPPKGVNLRHLSICVPKRCRKEGETARRA